MIARPCAPARSKHPANGSPSASHPETPIEETETYQVLLARARGKTGPIPAPLLVKHVLSVTREADWPVRREALEALLRRLSFGRRDALVIARRPPARRIYGPYETRRKRSSVRPYRTVLLSIDPPRGSCDCPDFLRSSLGVCKHLLAVIEDIARKPRRLAAALRQGEDAGSAGSRPRLIWDPVRPLRGDGDLLAQVRWLGGRGAAERNGAEAAARRWFQPARNGSGAAELTLKARALEDPRRRLELVGDILGAVKPSRRAASGGDPALVRLLQLERDRLERIVDEKIDRRSLRSALRSLRRKLYPYQREGVERFLASGRLLLADDMGLGKTAQAVACCHTLWRQGKVRRGMLIVPASLKPQWEREWRLFSDTPVTIVDGGPDERQAAYRRTKRGFLIVNYEQVLRDLQPIHRWNPDMVVLDEAQRIKNWATKTAAYVKTLQPRYRLVLTGTPMENRLEELASILDWVDEFALEPKWRLAPWHATLCDGRREVAGARNLDTLRSRLAGSMLRRVRKEVLAQLPPRTDVRVPVVMTAEQWERHEVLRKPIASLLNQAKKRPLTQAEFLKLMQLLATQRVISNGLAQMDFEGVWPEIASRRPTEARLRSLESPKLIELRELIRGLVVDQERKVVVFSQWRRMLELAKWATRDILEDAGLRAVFFTGHEGQKRRTQNVVDFHDDPATRVLLASDAGGVGLNLQRASNCCINLELPWNPAVLEQRIGRIYRLGQKRPIDVFNLVSEMGIESRIAGIAGTKQAFFESLFDGDTDSVSFEESGSFISRIEKVVDAPEVPEIAASGEDDAADVSAEDREIDEMLSRADESRDGPTTAQEEEDADSGKGPQGESTRRAARASSEGRPAPVSDLFSEVRIERREDGGMRIEAPPEAAAALGSLFDGMARLMREAANGG